MTFRGYSFYRNLAVNRLSWLTILGANPDDILLYPKCGVLSSSGTPVLGSSYCLQITTKVASCLNFILLNILFEFSGWLLFHLSTGEVSSVIPCVTSNLNYYCQVRSPLCTNSDIGDLKAHWHTRQWLIDACHGPGSAGPTTFAISWYRCVVCWTRSALADWIEQVARKQSFYPP